MVPRIFGAVMSLEGLRRGQAGGTMLAIFVRLEADSTEPIEANLDYLRTLNTIALEIIDSLPDFLSFVASPFRDYVIGSQCFTGSIDLILQEQQPPLDQAECLLYW